METYDARHALSLIERERCTIWNAVDSMVTPMLAHPDLDRSDRSTLRTGGIKDQKRKPAVAGNDAELHSSATNSSARRVGRRRMTPRCEVRMNSTR